MKASVPSADRPSGPAEEPIGYDPRAVEARWRTRWAERGTHHPDLAHGKDPFYALMMFPYPSAEGLHVGNLFAFTGNDIYGRFQRLKGHTVFEPLGYDAFGIHSENFALKMGKNPMDLIPSNVANFTRQLKRIGGMFDWEHSVDTTQPEYYAWTQWVFLQLLEAGLAEQKEAPVNWCPSCKTVLANEQVIEGRGWRTGALVEKREIPMYFLRITAYAEELLAALDSLPGWPEQVKLMQQNWIGRSEGARVLFALAGPSPAGEGERIKVFTTRPDTLFGASSARSRRVIRWPAGSRSRSEPRLCCSYRAGSCSSLSARRG